jgi:hypothetical protein
MRAPVSLASQSLAQEVKRTARKHVDKRKPSTNDNALDFVRELSSLVSQNEQGSDKVGTLIYYVTSIR